MELRDKKFMTWNVSMKCRNSKIFNEIIFKSILLLPLVNHWIILDGFYLIIPTTYSDEQFSWTKTFEKFYLLPPTSKNGTVESFCAKYGGLNEYLYSNLLCIEFALEFMI